jgi:hypothetical protein
MSFIRWSLVVFALLLLAACAGSPLAAAPTPEPSCAEQSAPFISQVQPLVQEWTDAATLAGQTPRVALAPQIDKLQEIRRRAQALEAPACAMPAKQHLVDSMDFSIKGFLAFLGQQSDSATSKLFTQATDNLTAFTNDIQHIQAGEVLTPMEPTFINGLGVTANAIQQAYTGVPFKEDTTTNGRARLWGTPHDVPASIEVFGPKDNIDQLVITAAPRNEDQVAAVKQHMQTAVTTALPDWKDGTQWVASIIDAKQPTASQTTRGRTVTLSYDPSAGSTVYRLIIKVQ